MLIKDILYQTPEMTEEKLLEIITKELERLSKVNKELIKRIQQIHNNSDDINKLILKEYDLIQDKKSYLSKSQREDIVGFVGTCIILMTNGGKTSSTD